LDTPTYNILDYLEKIDSVLFNSNKEYFAMPLWCYSRFNPTTAYIDVTGIQYGGGTPECTGHSTPTGKKFISVQI
jgi:hypothetical protein